MQIQWRGALFDAGQRCGIGGSINGVQMGLSVCPVSELTPQKIIEAAAKIEFAIRLQLEAAEKKAKADQTPV